jgi:hypothetical protein
MTIQLSPDFRYFLALLLERNFTTQGMAGRIATDRGFSRDVAQAWVQRQLQYAVQYRIVQPISLNMAVNAPIRLTGAGAWLRAVVFLSRQQIPY